MKFELTEAELKLRDELDADLVAINNGTMKTYTRAEFNAFSDQLIKKLRTKHRKRIVNNETELEKLAVV